MAALLLLGRSLAERCGPPMLTSAPAASASATVPSLPLYRRLAGDYAQAMGLGTLRVGERMPSVRELMRRHQVSLSTAL